MVEPARGTSGVGGDLSPTAVERLESALGKRQEIVRELRDLAYRDGELARHRAQELQAQLAEMAREVEHLLAEIEHLAGPPTGPRLDGQDEGAAGEMVG